MLGIFRKNTPPSSPLPLYLYNSATKAKESFTPLKAPHVSMYSCGPTVYDYVHIGNLRAFLMADTLKRVLIYNQYKVEHTMNFTDFGHLTDDADAGEDKMMKGLKRDGKPITLGSMHELADTYIDAFLKDAAAIRMLEPSHWTRASDYVRQQIALIKTLAEKGYAYETSDGLYFDIAKFPAYGILGNVDITKMKEGARVEVNPEKHHPADFALWKKGLLGWDSDWGKGFPGWHIECSAMAMATLGKQLDIHTGGEDNKYTHHNAEIAQSEAATGKPFVQYWLHSAFMQIDNTKISKSLGNSISLRNLEDRGYSGTDYRYWILTAHYRSNINFTFDSLDGAKKALFRLKRHLFEEYGKAKGSVDAGYEKRFHEAINDDLNTPKAIAVLWDMVNDKALSAGAKAATLRHFDAVLGLGLNDRPEDVKRELGVVPQAAIPADVEELLMAREAARGIRNWEEADRLRQAINLKGYTVEDAPEGPRVIKV
jgi:cysteinyl-tRNA synthetase